MQLFRHGHLEWTREESLAEAQSIVFVDLPERETAGTGIRENESTMERFGRHIINLQVSHIHLVVWITCLAVELTFGMLTASYFPATSSDSPLD